MQQKNRSPLRTPACVSKKWRRPLFEFCTHSLVGPQASLPAVRSCKEAILQAKSRENRRIEAPPWGSPIFDFQSADGELL